MKGKNLEHVKQKGKEIGIFILILISLAALGIFILHAIQSYSSYTPSNLSSPNLLSPNFSSSNLSSSNLSSSNLSSSNLSSSNVSSSNVSSSNLSSSNFTSPNFTSSNFTPGQTLYIAGNGSENFTCDGIDDQVEINQALRYVAANPQFTSVYLRGPNTYVISDSIFIGNNTTLEGDPSAIIKLEDNANWSVNKPLITQMNRTGINDVNIKGFEIDGNHDNNLDKKKGLGYYNMIRFINGRNIQVYDMYLHDGHGEGLKTESSYNVQFYNNSVYKLGHNGLFALDTLNIEAWNNRITCRTDCGLRVMNSNNIKFHDNVIDSFYHWSAGGPGILIEKTSGVVNNVEIYNNTIDNTYGPGIWVIGWQESYPREEAENVHIHHNIFYSTGTNPSIDWVGGIVTSGFYDTLIENNIFDGVYHAAIVHMYPTGTHIYPTYEGKPNLAPTGTGYTTIVRNNIIVNTQKRKKDPDGTGYAVINYLPEKQTFILENNCLYNNSAGNYLNCTSSTDIYEDPLLVNPNEHDYRLKAESPCIGDGYTLPFAPDGPVEKAVKSFILSFVSYIRDFHWESLKFHSSL